MKTFIIALITLLNFTISSYSMDEKKMKSVQILIDSAKTQADLNYASNILFNIWKQELENKEKELESILPKTHLKKFRSSMKSWRDHVEKMSRIRSELFKEDFMEPRYYPIRGIESKLDALKKTRIMQPYVYNMSKSIYYEEKWIELDVLLNTK